MFFGLFLEYARWHYGKALVNYLRILKNFWWFVVAYFSMPLLFKTLFVPYKRMTEETGRTVGSWLEAQVINSLSRLVGLVVRICLLAAGFAVLCLLTVGGIIGYAFWLVFPYIAMVIVTLSGILLISALLM